MAYPIDLKEYPKEYTDLADMLRFYNNRYKTNIYIYHNVLGLAIWLGESFKEHLKGLMPKFIQGLGFPDCRFVDANRCSLALGKYVDSGEHKGRFSTSGGLDVKSGTCGFAFRNEQK
jgi:hypothetical protein